MFMVVGGPFEPEGFHRESRVVKISRRQGESFGWRSKGGKGLKPLYILDPEGFSNYLKYWDV